MTQLPQAQTLQPPWYPIDSACCAYVRSDIPGFQDLPKLVQKLHGVIPLLPAVQPPWQQPQGVRFPLVCAQRAVRNRGQSVFYQASLTGCHALGKGAQHAA